MPDTKNLKSEISDLPLAEREEILSALEQSIADDHRSLAEEVERRNLAVCQERTERFDRGEGRAVPLGRALHEAFRQS